MYHLHVFQDSIIITGSMCRERQRRFQSGARLVETHLIRPSDWPSVYGKCRLSANRKGESSTVYTGHCAALGLTSSALFRCRTYWSTRRQRERDWVERFRYCVSDNASTDWYIHKVVKIPVLASILVNTVGYVLSERIQLRKNVQNSSVSCMTTCRS